MTFEIGAPYLLTGMRRILWSNRHEQYGTPREIAALYLGSVAGTRVWHIFEVRIEQRDAGALLFNEDDLNVMTVIPLGK